MTKLPHFILEAANNHGGDPSIIKKFIDQFSKLDYLDLGVKFHPAKYDKVALPDYSWYKVYTELFIDEENWRKIIDLGHKKIGKVWLDLFCVYGLSILEQNREKIWGIKLQPSILSNIELLDILKKMNLENKEFIVNLSGHEINETKELIAKLKTLNFRKIILQVGFQSYPTSIEDTSLKKIEMLKDIFPGYDLSFADHISAEDEFAQRFPIYAYLKGCTYIEKHACLSRKKSKYDHFSSLEYGEIKNILIELKKVFECLSTKFLPENEKKYLAKTFQKPIIRDGLDTGQLVSMVDLIYRRTDKKGMNLKEINDLQKDFYILNRRLEKNDTITKKDFKKARIGVVVAGRMKSTRLKNKALLPIQGVSSVERCLENCLKFPYAEEVILATSTLPEDAVLKERTLGGRVKFYQGDPDDVISRFIGAGEKYNLDVVVRVTADCPLVSSEIVEILIKSHFNEGADFTEPKQYAVGTNSDIHNVEALKRIIRYVGKADYSEYMSLYFRNNQEIFKVNTIDLPEQFIRNYRLTLDYEEDLNMFNVLYKKLQDEKLEINLQNVFDVLDKNPDIVNLNAHKPLIYRVDQDLIKRLNESTRINKELVNK